MRAFGKLGAPLFRPFLRRVDAYLNRHIAQLSSQLGIWQTQHLQALRDFDLLCDSLVREMSRLQLQITMLEENLQASVAALNENAPESPETALPALRRPTHAA